MQTDLDNDLLSYFTDVEHLRDTFKQLVAAPTLAKRLFVVWGIGGVGKSSLLRMFRLHCKEKGVPVALASGDEAKSALDVLARWTEDLKADGVAFPAFGKMFGHYRSTLTKAENEADKIAGKMVKSAVKTVTETVLSTIPGIGPLLVKLGGIGVDALTDMLLSRGFKKPDIDLLLDPTRKLTEDFLADVAATANQQRIVLMLDTFEQITALDDWAREVAQHAHPNALLVVAGRAVPEWDRAWPKWLATAQLEELKPMTEDVMRELVRQYYEYAMMRGGEPDPQQVEAIINFARGLPIAVTSMVQLWVKYPERFSDLKAISPEVMPDLVDRLLEGVPQALIPALEAAATMRWFDQPILRAVTGLADVRDVYNELRRFAFVRTRAEGLALHDAVREIMDANLRLQDSERHCELHERAAVYFERRLEKTTGEEAERLGLERLYHRVRADEEAGIKLFQEMAEELVRYRLVNRLHTLLEDAKTYPLERENSKLWREYYKAASEQLERNFTDAEIVYNRINRRDDITDERLLASVLLSWSEILTRPERLKEPSGCMQALVTLKNCEKLTSVSSFELAQILIHKARVYSRQPSTWEQAKSDANRAKTLYNEMHNLYGMVVASDELRGLYVKEGDWRAILNLEREILDRFSASDALLLKARFDAGWKAAWIWMGRYAEAESQLRQVVNIETRLGRSESREKPPRDLLLAIGMQNRYSEVADHFGLAVSRFEKLGKDFAGDLAYFQGFWGIVSLQCGYLEQAEKLFLQALESSSGLAQNADWEYYLGICYIVKGLWNEADQRLAGCIRNKNQNVNVGWYRYSECAALTGLVRVKYAQGGYAAIPPLLVEAEQLAQQYEYNDHLASLRLTQGHIAWDGHIPAWGNGFDSALRYYQQALIYALRYNRFLLDEVLSGRPQGSPLRPIIPYCLARGEEGRQMLIALRDWWQTGVNDIGAPRPDTISPIPEGIPLLEAERIAREREPGDGSPQKSVVAQLDAALPSEAAQEGGIEGGR
ncbi:MAG: hypothetical protein NT169_06755 [Chloroflexi bacterium]|nr:hypothetical protein [Chloroflexota bacterium]